MSSKSLTVKAAVWVMALGQLSATLLGFLYILQRLYRGEKINTAELYLKQQQVCRRYDRKSEKYKDATIEYQITLHHTQRVAFWKFHNKE